MPREPDTYPVERDLARPIVEAIVWCTVATVLVSARPAGTVATVLVSAPLGGVAGGASR